MINPKKCLLDVEVYKTLKYEPNARLRLDSNESPYMPSNAVVEGLKNLDISYYSHYPTYGLLVDKLAKNYGVNEDSILLTNGADEALSVIISTYLDFGDELLCFMPTFSMPKIYAKNSGAKFRGINYFEKWKFAPNKLLAEVKDNTKIIYISSPNNPTGDMVKFSDIELILSKCPSVAVVLDITYINWADDEIDYTPLAKKYDNLFIVKSFSKDYALAGLRLGFILTNENNINQLRKVISPYSVNVFAANAGLFALSDENYLKDIQTKAKIAKEALFKGLAELDFAPYKSEANFILCDFGKYIDFALKRFEAANILVRSFKNSEILKTCLRITVPKLEDVKFVLDALKPKKLLVFDLDGVVFDVSNSYRLAIKKTFEYFSKLTLKDDEIQAAKELGGLNCDWDTTKFLLKKYGFDIDLEDIKNVFQSMFFNKDKEGSKGLIDNEKLLIDKEIFESLKDEYDFAVFTGRPYDEAVYSLSKFDILKYFSKIITQDDVVKRKPDPQGLLEIVSSIKSAEVSYFGDTVDDIKAGINAKVQSIGVVAPFENNKKVLLDAGANRVIENIKDLKNFLKGAINANV